MPDLTGASPPQTTNSTALNPPCSSGHGQKVQNDTWLNPSLDIDCMDLGLLFVFSPVSVRAMVLVSLGTGRSVREM